MIHLIDAGLSLSTFTFIFSYVFSLNLFQKSTRIPIPGREINLFTGSTEDPFCNIYHEVLQQNISINGRHYAIAVEIDGQELIFDNIHPEGISRVNWINNLYCVIQDLGGEFQITETEF